jgi:hypothetical protein
MAVRSDLVLSEFITWLHTCPGDLAYNYHCPVARFLMSRGASKVVVLSSEMPLGFQEVLLPRPRTYGAAAERGYNYIAELARLAAAAASTSGSDGRGTA